MDLVSVGYVIGAFIIAIVVNLWLPGIEKKSEARIQQRLGPELTSPGIYTTFKFFFKQSLKPSAVLPRLYNALPIVTLVVVAVIYLLLIPQVMVSWTIYSSLVAIVGLLKIEEVVYVFMSSFSQSLLSKTMPFPDKAKGGKHREAKQSFFEQISAKRSLKLISYGSLPFYIALFIPAIKTGSIGLFDIVMYQQIFGPVLFSVEGVIGTIVFFIGFLIILNSNPFAYMEGHSDVIEGPLLEYMSKSRAAYVMAHALLIFTGACIYSTLFLGFPPVWGFSVIIPVIVSIILTIAAAAVSAMAPLFTNREFYPTVMGTSMIAVIGVLLAVI
ncbi:MAG: NADH-quinone oxidoreductase subunit H [Methanosphaera sp.]|nr:NADH-quinone oxidoreductase subunit H [Methanosphaera sp.]